MTDKPAATSDDLCRYCQHPPWAHPKGGHCRADVHSSPDIPCDCSVFLDKPAADEPKVLHAWEVVYDDVMVQYHIRSDRELYEREPDGKWHYAADDGPSTPELARLAAKVEQQAAELGRLADAALTREAEQTAEIERLEHKLVPCGCAKPLLGEHPPSNRCRLCDREFAVVAHGFLAQQSSRIADLERALCKLESLMPETLAAIDPKYHVTLLVDLRAAVAAARAALAKEGK